MWCHPRLHSSYLVQQLRENVLFLGGLLMDVLSRSTQQNNESELAVSKWYKYSRIEKDTWLIRGESWVLSRPDYDAVSINALIRSLAGLWMYSAKRQIQSGLISILKCTWRSAKSTMVRFSCSSLDLTAGNLYESTSSDSFHPLKCIRRSAKSEVV